jgi:hypothetical protein
MSIGWFPGHMASARKKAAETLAKVDIVVEVVDVVVVVVVVVVFGTVVVVVGTVVVVFGTVVGGTVVVVVPPGTLQAMPFSLQFVGATPRPAATYPMVIEPPAARFEMAVVRVDLVAVNGVTVLVRQGLLVLG